MIKRIIKNIVFGYNTASSWKKYKEYAKIHPTAIVSNEATLIIQNPWKPPSICLEIGEFSNISSTISIMRPQARVKIGKKCQLGPSHIACADCIEIGDNVLMAWGITIMDNDAHSLDSKERVKDIKLLYDSIKTNDNDMLLRKNWDVVGKNKISIHDNVWIGFNSIILKGVTIGENSIIGAGSVIRENIPPNCVVTGNPYRIEKKI